MISASPVPPVFSVVIPAHDEETVIERCLAAFSGDLSANEAEIVVIANGCADGTADCARKFPGVRVIERAEASKTAALNAGDAACTIFPRIYLDADIIVSATALRAVAARLSAGPELIASPAMAVELGGRPWAVRSFYRAFELLPYASEDLVGLGFYGLSAAGRARFGAFPDVIADDLYVSRQFTRDERQVLATEHFTVQAPRDLGSLVSVRTRVALGNRLLLHEHSASVNPDDRLVHTTRSTLRSLATVCVSKPLRVPDGMTYVLVTALARWRARSSSRTTWLTDRSTR